LVPDHEAAPWPSYLGQTLSLGLRKYWMYQSAISPSHLSP
jgi:hypothetical protein